jgi:endonuclease G
MPKSEKRLRVLENIGYVVGYDEKERNPAWVCYRLFRVSNPESLKRPSDFTVDTRTNSRVTHKDYTHSGYDRGHLAPNYGIVTRYGREAQLETFYMSNIVPQKAGLNRGIWRELEMKVAGDWANRLGEVWVITGTVYDHLEEELQSGVEIPDAFYKIVIDEHNGNLRVCSFLIPESATNQSYERFLTSIDRIEELTGLDFLHELPDSGEDAIEAWTPRQLPF